MLHFGVVFFCALLATGCARLLTDKDVDPDKLEVFIDIPEHKVRHGDNITIICSARLYDKLNDYDLKHLWLHDAKVEGKIAAFFPGRPEETILDSNGNVQEERGPAFGDHYQKLHHGMLVSVNETTDKYGRLYTLTVQFPKTTCYQHTKYHCWAFAIPIPQPKETDSVLVTVNPCQDYVRTPE